MVLPISLRQQGGGLNAEKRDDMGSFCTVRGYQIRGMIGSEFPVLEIVHSKESSVFTIEQVRQLAKLLAAALEYWQEGGFQDVVISPCPRIVQP